MSEPYEVYPTVYPNPSIQTPAPTHHSNGSFGTVFVVLAAIVIISAIACCLGRLCNKRLGDHDHSKGKQGKAAKEKNGKKKNVASSEGDIEFGFDKRLSSAKVAAHEDFRGPKGFQKDEGDIEFGFGKKSSSAKGPKNEEFRGPRGFNGQNKKEVRFAKDGALK